MNELPVLHSGEEAADHCRCDGGQPKNFARPCLLLLGEAPAHGYELVDRMRPFGFEINDPASVYKTLRQMEQDGLVSSQWELSTRGPARRVYSLTTDGRDLLEAWAFTLDKNRAILEHFLERYRAMNGAWAPRGEAGAPLNSSGEAGGVGIQGPHGILPLYSGSPETQLETGTGGGR